MDEENNRWIENGLTASFEHLDLRAAPAQARYQTITPHWRRKRMSFLAGLPAILTTKAAAAAAIALTAAGGAVATKAAVTGDPNPLNWGATVTQQVQTCKADLTAGEHGIGACVSGKASQHGQQERQTHANANSSHATGAPTNAATHPTGNPNSTHPTGAPSGTETGPPSSAAGQATGEPTTHPTGRPTTH